MKLNGLLVVLAACVVAGCGKPPTSRVEFVGFTPHSSLEKDLRAVRAYCPKCNFPVDASLDTCPKTYSSGEACEFELIYDEEYPCAFCNATGTCKVCFILEQKDGKCYTCQGEGVLTYLGKTVECPGCKGTKSCVSCSGRQKCDYCSGEGSVSGDTVRQRALKPSEDGKSFEEPKGAAKEGDPSSPPTS